MYRSAVPESTSACVAFSTGPCFVVAALIQAAMSLDIVMSNPYEYDFTTTMPSHPLPPWAVLAVL
jgi:hypothetical protein